MRSRGVRWVVRPGEGPRLRDVLARLGPRAQGALEQGRVFVGDRRASSAEIAVSAGDVVSVRSARAVVAPARIVLDRRGGLIAVDKPAALPTEPDAQGSASVRSLLARELGVPESSLHAVSRLDVGVSGVVLLAMTAEARAHVAALREASAIARRYVGICAGAPEPRAGRWQGSATERGRTRHAVTLYRSLGRLELEPGRLMPGRFSRAALLALDPITGRMHQLRRHAAAGAAPLLGDRRYGGPQRLREPDGAVFELNRVLLHARSVSLSDEQGRDWTVRSELPDELCRAWRALGGADADFLALDG